MLSATPLAFSVNKLKDIHDVAPRSPGEDACFQELREVLTRHGLQDRYGITLLHKHFDLAGDEILVEYTDVAARTLVSRPVKIGEVPDRNLVEVTWSLASDTVLGACKSHCYYDFTLPRHDTRHTAEGITSLPICVP